MQTKLELRQERNFSEKINAVFEFLRENIVDLGRGLLFIALPVLLIAGAVLTFATAEMLKSQASLQSENMGNVLAMFSSGEYIETFYMYLVRALIPSMINYSIVASVVYGYIFLYLQNPSEKITVERLLDQVKSKFGTIFFTYIGMTLILFFSAMFFVIPMIYLSVPLMFLVIVRLIEDVGFGQAFSRCFDLLKDEWWNTFGLFLVMFIIQGVLSFIFQIPATVYQSMMMLGSLSENGVFEPDLLYQGLFLLGVVGDQLLYTLLFLTVSFQYFNLVEKKEATGLSSRIDNIGN